MMTGKMLGTKFVRFRSNPFHPSALATRALKPSSSKPGVLESILRNSYTSLRDPYSIFYMLNSILFHSTLLYPFTIYIYIYIHIHRRTSDPTYFHTIYSIRIPKYMTISCWTLRVSVIASKYHKNNWNPKP